jgi:hypothetical protein
MNEKAALLPDKAPVTESGGRAGTLAQQSAPARKVFREVMGWLEESYDEASKRYKKGFSDLSIAEETGAAPQFVAKTREDYFGPLGTPPEIDAIRGDLAANLRATVELEKEFNRKVDAMRHEFFVSLKSAQDHRNKIEAKIASLAKEQGWS